jgi:hypothetical protein
MRYFYVKQAKNVALNADQSDDWFEIRDLEDPRIKAGTIQEMTRYTGYLEIDEPLPVIQELPFDEPVEDGAALVAA